MLCKTLPHASSRRQDATHLSHFKAMCSRAIAYLRGNEACKLVLESFPDNVYETVWDMIMIDASNRYFSKAPRWMVTVFSTVMMASNRKEPNVTHALLHDVERKVEKVYMKEFLCKKNLVNDVGRLSHFQIPPSNNTYTSHFCYKLLNLLFFIFFVSSFPWLDYGSTSSCIIGNNMSNFI